MALPLIAAAAGAKLIGGIIGAIPGKMERAFRKDILADRKRLSNGGGGLAAGDRQRLQAEAMGNIQAQQESARAQLARGSAMGGGASGMQTQQMSAITRAGMDAGNAAGSNIRQQDLDLAERQRQGLYARMQAAQAGGAARKQALMSGIEGAANMAAANPNMLDKAPPAGLEDKFANANAISNIP